MGVWDDFVEVLSDGADAAGELIDDVVELGEEGLEEAANLFLEKILGIDIDGSDEGSPSEGHDYDSDYGDTSDELQVAADPMDRIITTVHDASSEPWLSHLLLTDDIYGMIDDAVSEPDATHVFDAVAGTVADIVTETETRPLRVAGDGYERGDTSADSLQFIPAHSAHTPEWTDFNQGDPSTGLLEAPSFLGADSILGHDSDRGSTRAGASMVDHVGTNAQARVVDLPDLEGADDAIVADSIQPTGAIIFADSLESTRAQPGSDALVDSLDLLPLQTDGGSAYDPLDEPVAHSVHLTETGFDFATSREDASSSHSLSWLF